MFKPEEKSKLIALLSLKDDAADADIAGKVLEALETSAATATKLSRAETDLATANGKVNDLAAKLASKEPIQLSRDVQGVLEEAVDTKLGMLADKCAITPAVADKLGKVLKSGGAVMLSRETAGGETSRAMAILSILAENDAADLAKRIGEKSPGQRVALSRTNHDEDINEEDAAALRDRMAKKASEGGLVL